MEMQNLFAPSGGAAWLRAPNAGEAEAIASALLRIPTPALRGAACDALADAVDRSLARGGGILAVGLAPADLEIAGDGFAARCDLLLDRDDARYEIRVEGELDERGRIRVAEAALLAVRHPVRA